MLKVLVEESDISPEYHARAILKDHLETSKYLAAVP